MLEICCYSIDSALMAQRGGAQRIELCDNVYEGGTTPSYGTIKKVRAELDIDVNIIVRPRGSDFVYSKNEFEIMKEDIEMSKMLGVDGIVIGLLNTDGTVDISRTKALVELARPMSVTFHRAFDLTLDFKKSLEDVIATGCDRILSSGQENKAVEGLDTLAKMVKQANGRIIIMPGSSLDENNVKTIKEATNANEFHGSLRTPTESKMKFRKQGINMGGVPNISEYEIFVSDPERIRKVVEIINQ